MAGINLKIIFNFVKYKIFILRDRYASKNFKVGYSPINASIWLTSRCNMFCKFCHYRNELSSVSTINKDLDFAKFKILYEKHRWINKSLRFSLYGGEPLLNPLWPQFVTYLKQHGHLVSINTNGTLLEKNYNDLLRVRPSFISVSYYPENLAILNRALPEITKVIPIRMSFLLTVENSSHLDQFFEHAKLWGVSLVAVDGYVSNGILDMKNDGLKINENEVINKYKKKYQKNFNIEWKTIALHRPKTHCRFFWNSIFINEEAAINSCSVWRRDSFLELSSDWWNGCEMQKLRKQMKENMLPDGCKNCDYAFIDISGG